MIVMWMRSVVSSEQEVLADLPDSSNKSTAKLFHTFRPDIAVCDSSSVNVLELTICHETNLNKSKQYKLDKYRSLANYGTALTTGKLISCYSIEISTLGFISSCDDFTKANKIPGLPVELKQSIIRSVLSSSFRIYCSRNSI